MAKKDKEGLEKEVSNVAETTDLNIESLKQALAEEKEKAEKYMTNWQHAEADFSNYKKRVEQEKNELGNFANSTLILNLLPVLDDLERAFDSLPHKVARLTWVDGVKLIYNKLQSTLEAQGLTKIEAIGKPFDPSFHDAVAQMEGQEGMVIDEVQRGYKLKDKVLRPSRVVVGKGKEEKTEAMNPEETAD